MLLLLVPVSDDSIKVRGFRAEVGQLLLYSLDNIYIRLCGPRGKIKDITKATCLATQNITIKNCKNQSKLEGSAERGVDQV